MLAGKGLSLFLIAAAHWCGSAASLTLLSHSINTDLLYASP